jgi:hypothetical protein
MNVGMTAQPLNGMRGRAALCRALLRTYSPTVVIETGTFQGRTTRWLRRHTPRQFKVVTMELQKKVRGALPKERGVAYVNGDSGALVSVLCAMCSPYTRPFFYLDAHGVGPYPLRAELLAIGALSQALVLVDDCAVPHDAGYTFLGFDFKKAGIDVGDLGRYGLRAHSGEALSARQLRRWIPRRWRILWPSYPSSREGLIKTGCAIVCDPWTAQRVQQLNEVRR